VNSRQERRVPRWLPPRLLVPPALALLLILLNTDLPWTAYRAVRPLLGPAPIVHLAAPYVDDLRGEAAVPAALADGLRVRAAPDGAADVRATLPPAAALDVVEGPVQAVSGAWYQVRAGDAAGWVAAPYLDAVAAPAAPAGWQDAVVAPGPLPYTPVRPLPAPAAPAARFGLVEAFRLSEPDAPPPLGASYERLVFWWRALQDRPGGALNPHYLPQAILADERRQGKQLVGVLINTPEWAAARPSDGPRAVPRGLDLPWDDPDNLWGRFVEAMARGYAGQIDDWTIWNEPDIQPDDPNGAYYAWAGSVEEYYQLLRVAYLSAKRGNPAARVHLAGLTYWVDRRRGQPQYFERLLDLMAADPTAPANDYYFDVATLHLYTDPRALYDVPRLYRALMQARGLDKPIWIDETNVVPWDDPTNRGTGYDVPTDMRCTLVDQAGYVLQAFGLGLAGGAERVAFYKAQDSPGAALNGEVDAIERAAVVREDGSPRPAYVAYQAAARYLGDAEASTYFPGASVESVVAARPGGTRTTVLWNGAPEPVVARLPAAGVKADLIDAAGRAHRLVAAPDGAYAIALPGATCATDPDNPKRYLLGGETYLIVEYGVAADAPVRAARPES
jgi:hypothetical protein